MAKTFSYQKVTDDYTTHALFEPDYEQMPEDTARITELCTIDGVAYVHVPDGLVLPTQPKQISLKSIMMTPQLKTKIKKASPHARLMEKRIAKEENIRLSKQDENTLGFLSEFMVDPEVCTAYIAKCREWNTGKAL